MLNESTFLYSFNEIKNLLLNEVNILHVSVVYVLMYVIYRSFRRYIYFKPEEHASKINRTFLTLSVLIVFIYKLEFITNGFPIISEYRWLYILGTLVILIAPLSIITFRIIWECNKYGVINPRNWHCDFLPIPRDYYKTSVSQSETTSSNGYLSSSRSWEVEGVESTFRNIHSDALLNLFAVIIFAGVMIRWSLESSVVYGWSSIVFSAILCLVISGIFIDRAVFSWIDYIEKKVRQN